MTWAELVFVPSPGVGHLVSAIQVAKLLVDRDDRLSITVLIMKLPFDSIASTYTQSLPSSNRIHFVDLPHQPDSSFSLSDVKPSLFLNLFIKSKKPQVREAVTRLLTQSETPLLAGFVLDMFCTAMIDVAIEFGVPSYIFFTSSAAFLDLSLYMLTLHDEHNKDVTEFKNSDAEFAIPSLLNPVPSKVLPNVLLDKDSADCFFEYARRFREAKGIMINTFMELETRGVKSFQLDGTVPPVYPVGPILNLDIPHGESGRSPKKQDVMGWLDDQPTSSVVFLCFGSMGAFGEDQVKEIACALEQSGFRFLWSLRKPPPKGQFALPSEHTDFEQVLPEGFLDRTAGIGKVIGWAPQVAILAHPAIGGFVSHCGWNSTLESLWFGVPIATWPMYAEQQFNAFTMAVELGLAAEIKLDYRKDEMIIVSAGEIERGIKCVMEHDSDIRNKVKDMSDKCRKAITDGGSSYSFLGRLIKDVMDNIP